MEIPETLKQQMIEVAEEMYDADDREYPEESYEEVLEYFHLYDQMTQKMIAIVKRAESHQIPIDEFLTIFDAIHDEVGAQREAMTQ